MKFDPTYKKIWGISYPIILAGIAETIVDITDTIFLAHYGTTELAAIGLADAIYGVALFLTLGLVDGIQIIIGRRAGQGKKREIGRVFNQGIYLLLLASALMVTAIVLVVPDITATILESDSIDTAVNQYLQIAAYSLFFQSISMALSAFYVGISRTRILIGAAIMLAATNIALDYLLIFGNFGLPELGIEGAAIASLAAEFATLAFLTADTVRKHYIGTYSLFRFGRWNSNLALMITTISTPVSLEALIETARWFGFFLIIERLGETPLAAANIIYSCYALYLLPTDAFDETIASMVSNLIGQKRDASLALFLRRVIKLCYSVVAPLLILSAIFPDIVLSAFTEEEALISLSVNSLYVIILAVSIAVPASAFYSAVVGTGDTLITLLSQLAITVTTLLFAYYAAIYRGFALEFVWLAEVLGWLVCLSLSWFWFRSGFWQRLQL